jgi:RES domain-containing protein
LDKFSLTQDVKLIPNPRYSVFLAELKKVKKPFSAWKGLLFRASPLSYAQSAKLLSGQGSFGLGGRWSAAGTFPAVNASTDQATCIAESSASFTYYNWAPSDVRPKIVVAVRVNFIKVLNLVSSNGLRSMPWLELDKLLAEDWHKVNDANHEAQSQSFGRAAHDMGAEGLLVPSARVRGGVNLVYFPKSIGARSKVELLGEEELNRWIKKK